ncbi:uncharacterized protein LOC114277243 [Camellia sinensis]|uniref:uncharacterized protein LOC114277243 n=1 Tax=Camellia sinensis TaxID=4442 RepID=UPI0010366E4B|nr:uncharacterized protein LOC114277243 [Camellia sinensis]
MPTSGEVTTHSGRPSDSLFNDHRQPVPQRPRPLPFFPKDHHSVTILVLLLKLRELPYLPLYGVTRQSCQAILATNGLAKSNLQSYLMTLEKKFCNQECGCSGRKKNQFLYSHLGQWETLLMVMMPKLRKFLSFQVDNLEFLREMRINPIKVAKALVEVFAEMILMNMGTRCYASSVIEWRNTRARKIRYVYLSMK